MNGQLFKTISRVLTLIIISLYTASCSWPLGTLLPLAFQSGGDGGIKIIPPGSSAPGDTTPPTIQNIVIYDCDGNGIVDEIVVSFDETMSDASLGDADAGRFKFNTKFLTAVDVTSGGTKTPVCSSTGTGGVDPSVANDNVITLFTNDGSPGAVEGTGPADFEYTTSVGQVTDSAGNELEDASFTASATEFIDKAAPVIVGATTENGINALTVIISEPVDNTNNSSCDATIANTDFTYTDAGGGVTAISGTPTDNNACDDNTIILIGDTLFVAADVVDPSEALADTIAALGSTIYDVAGNAMGTTALLLKGIIKPYVVGVVSVSPTEARVTYSEDVITELATAIPNYTMICNDTAAPCSCAGGDGNPVTINSITGSGSQYTLTTATTQDTGCLYTLNVAGDGLLVTPISTITNPSGTITRYTLGANDLSPYEGESPRAEITGCTGEPAYNLSGGPGLTPSSITVNDASNYVEIDSGSFTAGGDTTGCSIYLYTISDVNEQAAMIAPKFGTFVGQEQLKVVNAEAVSLRSFVINFSKDVKTGTADNTMGGFTGNYTIPASLGTVTSAVVSGNQVTITHSNDQGVGVYSVVVSTTLRNSGDTENLQPNPKDRTSFVGFGGNIEKLEDGSLFNDPFADGSSFAFAFEYGGKIYLGPNDTNEGVFRFDPDGGNATLVTFNICDDATCSVTKSTFGANLIRPISTVTTTDDTVNTTYRYDFPAGSNLANYDTSSILIATGCTNADFNKTGTATVVDDANDYVEIVVAGVVTADSTTETCEVQIYNGAGPSGNNFDGVDAFVKANVGGTDYLVFGAHNEGGGGFQSIYFTTDVDDVLDINYCDINSATLGNTTSLQTIYGYGGSSLITAFASDSSSGSPLLSIHDLTVTGAACNGIGSAINGNASSGAKKIPYLGWSGSTNADCGGGSTAPNPAAGTQIGIDSTVYFGSKLYLANNGGINTSSVVPPTTCGEVQTNIVRDGDATWTTGTTQAIPGIGQLRPGEKGIPFMVEFDGSGSNLLYVARNRSDNNTAELWTYDGATWSGSAAIKTGDTVGADTVNGTDISMVIVNGNYLYVGFDNETTGAEVYRSTDGSTWTKVGVDGLGPQTATAAERRYNKYIISSATVFFDGQNYLYITSGCNRTGWMFDDDGSAAPSACDRDTNTGSTDFSIKVFRQID